MKEDARRRRRRRRSPAAERGREREGKKERERIVTQQPNNEQRARGGSPCSQWAPWVQGGRAGWLRWRPSLDVTIARFPRTVAP